MTPTRLYGLPDWENLLADPTEVIDRLEDDDDTAGPWTLVVWSVHPQTHHLPSVEDIIEFFKESVEDGETDEGWYDSFVGAIEGRTIRGYIDAMRNAVASRIKYQMADERLATHQITFDDQQRYLIDGVRATKWKDPS